MIFNSTNLELRISSLFVVNGFNFFVEFYVDHSSSLFTALSFFPLSGTRDPSHANGTSTRCPGPIFSYSVQFFEQIPSCSYFLNETSFCPIFLLA